MVHLLPITPQYAAISEQNQPAELIPQFSTLEYTITRAQVLLLVLLLVLVLILVNLVLVIMVLVLILVLVKLVMLVLVTAVVDLLTRPLARR